MQKIRPSNTEGENENCNDTVSRSLDNIHLDSY